MRYPLIVFDFDGTLADSLGAAIAAFRKLAPQLGLKPLADLGEAQRLTSRQLVRRLGVRPWQLPRVVRAFRAEAARHTPNFPLHEGVPEMIRALHESGHRLGVVSSNCGVAIRDCLRRHDLERHFGFVLGTPSLFGKRRVIRAALQSEAVSPRHAVYVGDETRDIEAGRRAGVATLAVTWGFHAAELLRAESPTWVADNPAAVPGLVSGCPRTLARID